MIGFAFVKTFMVNNPTFKVMENRVCCHFLMFHGSKYEKWVPDQVIICILNQSHQSKQHTAALCEFPNPPCLDD